MKNYVIVDGHGMYLSEYEVSVSHNVETGLPDYRFKFGEIDEAISFTMLEAHKLLQILEHFHECHGNCCAVAFGEWEIND